MLLYTTSLAAADDEVNAVVPDANHVLQRAQVREGTPFVLGPDGSYDVVLNRFCREMDGWGVRSSLTVVAYARDLTLFARFLHQRRGGRTIWQAEQSDLRAYKHVRRWSGGAAVPEGGQNRVTPRGLAVVSVNAEYESDEESEPVRVLSFEDYLLWRGVGLRARLLDGAGGSVVAGTARCA